MKLNNKSTIKYFILSILSVIAIFMLWVTYPIPWVSRQVILLATPIGSDIGDVVIYCRSNHMEYNVNSKGYGYNSLSAGIGDKSIRAIISPGKYGVLLIGVVTADWAFDKNGKLIDVYVNKYIDAP